MARTADEVLRDAEHARLLQENPLFQRLVNELDQHYVTAWRNCADPTMREKLHGMVCVVEDFRRNVQATLDAGKIVIAQKQDESRKINAAAEDHTALGTPEA